MPCSSNLHRCYENVEVKTRDLWLHAAFHAGIPELRAFVKKLRQDQQAVQSRDAGPPAPSEKLQQQGASPTTR